MMITIRNQLIYIMILLPLGYLNAADKGCGVYGFDQSLVKKRRSGFRPAGVAPYYHKIVGSCGKDADDRYKEHITLFKTEVSLMNSLIPTKIIAHYKKKGLKTPLDIISGYYGSREAAQRAMLVKHRFEIKIGGPGQRKRSGFLVENTWRINDIRSIHRALELIPRELRKKAKGFTDIQLLSVNDPNKGKTLAGGFTVPHKNKETTIFLTQVASNLETPGAVVHIILHELAHLVDLTSNKCLHRQSDYATFKDFVSTSRSRKGKIKVFKPSRGICSISEYSKKSPAEHYAEMFAWFVTNPKKLLKKCPRHYKYMHKLFGSKKRQKYRSSTHKPCPS